MRTELQKCKQLLRYQGSHTLTAPKFKEVDQPRDSKTH